MTSHRIDVRHRVVPRFPFEINGTRNAGAGCDDGAFLAERLGGSEGEVKRCKSKITYS